MSNFAAENGGCTGGRLILRHMTVLDIIILAVALGSAFMGWRKGIVLQLGGLAAIVAGIIACRFGGDWLAAFLENGNSVAAADPAGTTPDKGYFYTVLSRVILFIAGYALVKMVARFLRGVTHALQIGFLDRVAGALFCLFEWMVVLSLALNLWVIVKPTADVCKHSTIFNGHAVEAVMGLAPKVLGWAMEQGADTLSGVVGKLS